MANRVLVVGGSGRIGSAVAYDLFTHTDAHLVLTGRDRERGAAAAARFGRRGDFLELDLDRTDVGQLIATVRAFDLIVLCAGPFRMREPRLLEACIQAGVNYVDVCDDKQSSLQHLALDATARAAGVTALVGTGTFPGIDNVMVADALARYPNADDVRLFFVCAGSGGGGFGVLQTTFLVVSRPYEELREGRWRAVPAYAERQVVDMGPVLGYRPVFTFEVPELWSLPHHFPRLQNCTAKFGTAPGIWNWATWALARAPASVRTDVDFLDRSVGFILPVVHWLDRFVGEELAVRVEIHGAGVLLETIIFSADSTTEAVGWATGEAAAMVLNGEIDARGVWLPEMAIPGHPYLDRLVERGGRLIRAVAPGR
jgi:saccharopine dehydrogenase-like NADP-dependent oxidoreductase